MTRRASALWVGILALMLLVAGCGSGSPAPRGTASHSSHSPPGSSSVPAPGPTGAPADPDEVAVIKAWSSALRRGDVRRAAAFFALPSEMINAGVGGRASVIAITSLRAAEAANESLPCGAQLVAAERRGRFINALFLLMGRRGSGGTNCGGTRPAQTARTNFLIRNGRIVLWLRAPDDPGDNRGAPRPPAPEPPPAGQPAPAV